MSAPTITTTIADGRTLRAGTRGSPLALIQTRMFIEATARGTLPPGIAGFEPHVIDTTGDKVQDRLLATMGGKGLFAKEIHEALADGRIDCAVHSLKDLETELPPGVVLACTLAREDPRDALILGGGPAGVPAADDPYGVLPAGALIGTASVRRQSQLLHARPDLRTTIIRGNVQTRLRKLGEGSCVATMLAYAGLIRIGRPEVASLVLDPDVMVPAAGQGIVGVTIRARDEALRALLATIEDAAARAAATAERAMLGVLDGSCRTPIGAHAQLLPEDRLVLTGLVARADGSFLLRRSTHGAVADAARIGAELGAELRADSPDDLFA